MEKIKRNGIAVAGSVCRYMNEAEDKTITAAAVIESVCELDKNGEHAQMILEMYELLRAGKTFGEIRRIADKQVAREFKNIV